jgi:hypothetical protein
MMDANTSLHDDSSPLKHMVAETSLVDAFQQVTGESCNIPTYVRGSQRIDYIFTSQQLIPFINKVGYLGFYESNDSNHRGLFVDVNDSILDNKVKLKRSPRRSIGFSSPEKNYLPI